MNPPVKTRDWPLAKLLTEIDDGLGKVGVYLSYVCEKDEVKNNPQLAGDLSVLTSMIVDAIGISETLVSEKDDEDA